MTLLERLELLFRDFHYESRALREDEVDFEDWAQQAFEVVMGKAPSHEEEDRWREKA